jgi:hypothetical protein
MSTPHTNFLTRKLTIELFEIALPQNGGESGSPAESLDRGIGICLFQSDAVFSMAPNFVGRLARFSDDLGNFLSRH